MIQVLAEADTGIEAQRLTGDAGGGECRETLLEKPAHLGHHVFIMRSLLHGARTSLHVHDHHPATGGSAEPGHVRIRTQAAHVVDDVGPGTQCGQCHRGLHGIDGNQPVPLGTQGADHRQRATGFLHSIHRLRPGAGGFTTDVDNLRTLGDHPAGVLKGGLHV